MAAIDIIISICYNIKKSFEVQFMSLPFVKNSYYSQSVSYYYGNRLWLRLP